jgi:hypothetical protein
LRIDNQLGAMGMKRNISALVAVIACAGACAGAATARTADTSAATKECSKVSPSSVAAIVGHSVPAAVGEIVSEKATKKNFNVSFQTLDCTYGVETSLSGLKKAVSISIETLSRSLTSAELKKLVSSQQKTPGLKITPYPGLGGSAYYMTASAGGIRIESLVTGSGTKLYGATVQTNLSKSKLESLLKLAQQL